MAEDTMPHADLYEATQRLLIAAMDRDPEGAAREIAQVGEARGNAGVYALCCGLASVIQKLGGQLAGQPSGELFAYIENLTDQPLDETDPGLWAARFFTAFVNQDGPQSTALFWAPLEAGDEDAAVANVCALVRMVGDCMRQADQRKKATRD